MIISDTHVYVCAGDGDRAAQCIPDTYTNNANQTELDHGDSQKIKEDRPIQLYI